MIIAKTAAHVGSLYSRRDLRSVLIAHRPYSTQLAVAREAIVLLLLLLRDENNMSSWYMRSTVACLVPSLIIVIDTPFPPFNTNSTDVLSGLAPSPDGASSISLQLESTTASLLGAVFSLDFLLLCSPSMRLT